MGMTFSFILGSDFLHTRCGKGELYVMAVLSVVVLEFIIIKMMTIEL